MSIIKKRTVDSIMADISAKVRQLREVATAHKASEAEFDNIAEEAHDKAREHGREAERAERLATKWEELAQ